MDAVAADAAVRQLLGLSSVLCVLTHTSAGARRPLRTSDST
jgi:hypothetical protein